jgi:hypothetical protein
MERNIAFRLLSSAHSVFRFLTRSKVDYKVARLNEVEDEDVASSLVEALLK